MSIYPPPVERSHAALRYRIRPELTLAAWPFVPPAPRPIRRAVDVGGAKAVVTGVTAEGDHGSVFVARSVNDLPLAVVQREGADTGTHHDCGRKTETLLNEVNE